MRNDDYNAWANDGQMQTCRGALAGVRRGRPYDQASAAPDKMGMAC
jgi:hypothetical protein